MISKDNEKLASIQRKELEILHELDRVCKLCKVNYYLSSGSCLGALRHKGFIPWDDDIDVYMFWKDAEKLVQNQHLFKKNYFVQCKKTDSNTLSTSYKLRDSNSTLITQNSLGIDMNQGFFIDIYILYPYPDNKVYALLLIWFSFLYRILQAGKGPVNHGKFACFIGNIISKLLRGNTRKKIIQRIEKAYKQNGGKKYYATYFGRDVTLTKSIVYPRSWFEKPIMLNFEDMIVACPGNPNEYCKLQYGETFMQLPPKEKQKPHIDYVVCEPNIPYMNFKGHYF